VGWKAVIKLAFKGSITPSANLGCKPLEFYNVIIDALSITHIEVFKLHFRVSGGIMRTKVGLELKHELGVVIHPIQMDSILIGKEIQFKPLKSHALEVGLGKVDFSPSGMESLGFALEVELTLNKECVEFARLGSFKSIWFSDFDFRVFGYGGVMAIPCKIVNSFRQPKEETMLWVQVIIVIIIITWVIVWRISTRSIIITIIWIFIIWWQSRWSASWCFQMSVIHEL
jgi:hypothetical protein